MTSYANILTGLGKENSARHYETLDDLSSRFITSSRRCETGAVGTDLAAAEEAEATGHSWRAIALSKENRVSEALGEASVAINIERPLLGDTSLSPANRIALLANYNALLEERDAFIKKGGVEVTTVPNPTPSDVPPISPTGAIFPVSPIPIPQNTQPVAKTKLDGPSATAICRMRLLEGGYLIALALADGSQAQVDAFVDKAEANGSAQEAVANGDGSMERAVDGGDAGDRVEIAMCLVRLNQLDEARKVLTLTYHDFHGTAETNGVVSTSRLEVAHQLALVEERLGLHAAALTHISIACPNCEDDSDGMNLSSDPYLSDSIGSDFKRIAAEKVRAAANARTLQSKGFWSALSTDERNVVKANGGSQLDVVKGYPCHVETYDASRYHQEVWWYGCDAGGYDEGYTFLNGKLTSTYSP